MSRAERIERIMVTLLSTRTSFYPGDEDIEKAYDRASKIVSYVESKELEALKPEYDYTRWIPK